MKSQVVCQLLAFIGLHREGIAPERDMIFWPPPMKRQAGGWARSTCLRRWRSASRLVRPERGGQHHRRGGALARPGVGSGKEGLPVYAAGGGTGDMARCLMETTPTTRSSGRPEGSSHPAAHETDRAGDEVHERPLAGQKNRGHAILRLERGPPQQKVPRVRGGRSLAQRPFAQHGHRNHAKGRREGQRDTHRINCPLRRRILPGESHEGFSPG